MSIGMIVQTSILESPVRSLSESPCRALQGNGLEGNASYEQINQAWLSTQGNTGPLVNNPPYANNYDFATNWNNGFSSPDVAAKFAVAAGAIFVDYTWGTISASTVPAANGWNISLDNAQYGGGAFAGMAKNTTGVVLPYFILFHKAGFGLASSSSPEYILPGVTTFTYELSLFASGYILPSKVIGAGCDIDLPYPSDNPWPLLSDNNNAIQTEAYYAIIGQDPSVWAASQGLQFGSFTTIS